MKLLKRFVKVSFIAALVFCTLLWSLVLLQNSKIADSYFINENSDLDFGKMVTVAESERAVSSDSSSKSTDTHLYLFGLIPIKTVNITRVETKKVVPGGIPFGIKMLSDSVIVADLSYVLCRSKSLCPAKDAGVCKGDKILSINGERVKSNNDVTAAISKSGGKPLNLTLQKSGGATKNVCVNPVKDYLDGEWKIGILVRDSSAGIGTITFYEPQSKSFAGLGHAVCDSSLDEPISLTSGEVVIAEIDSVTPSKKGSPGQLNGHFQSDKCVGEIYKNDETGVYGTLSDVKSNSEGVDIALKQQIKTGKATILTTLSGTQAQEYEIEIERISLSTDRVTKNMVIRVTDSRLLKETGGIVQGMSGSPILQNGKLVGAVTHVFVNDCTRGYGIFAENMLETAQDVYKKAS